MNREDIKLYKSQNMSDTAEGGGAKTSTVVIDGKTNEVFPDISTIDITSGDFSLRKTYVGIDTADNSRLMDAHVYFTEPPESSLINVAMFKADSEAEVRSQALDRVQSFFSRQLNRIGIISYSNGSPVLTVTSGVEPLSIGDKVILIDDNGNVQSAKVEAGGGSGIFNITLDHPVSPRLVNFGGVGAGMYKIDEAPSNDFFYGVATVDTAVNINDQSVSVVNARQRVKPLFPAIKNTTGSFKPQFIAS